MLYPQMNGCREKFDLSGFWQFTVDQDKAGEEKGWHTGFGEGRLIAVPGSFNEQFQNEDFPGIDIKNYMGMVWYQTEFFVPQSWQGRRIWIRVGAAFYSSKVWVNGQYAGSNEGSYFPFDFEITDYVRHGEENQVVISVDSELGPLTIPIGTVYGLMAATVPKVSIDHFPYGGINRPVLVYSTPQSYISGIRVDTDICGADGLINYSIDIEGDVESIRVTLEETPEITELHEGSASISGCLKVKGARLWGPKDPYLYHVKVEILENGSVKDCYVQSVGIRTIRVVGDQLLLNGEPIFLRGAGKHEDAPIIGKGLFPAQMVKDYSLLRWLGANSWRSTHYPYSEEMMDLADREGMLVVGEVPGTAIDWGLATPEFMTVHKEFVRRTIEKDRNRPSVIAWVLANEPMDLKHDDFYGEPPAEFVEYFKEICDYAHSLDSRPIAIVDCTFNGEKLHENCDIVALNRYRGWYTETAQLEEGFKALSEDLDKYYNALKKPILITEFGADAIAGMHYDPPEMWTEEYQAKMVEGTIKVAESKPYCIGTLVWTFADFKTCQMLRRIILNHKGLFTRDRQPKLAAHVVRKLWS